jgi:hypothetical protein
LKSESVHTLYEVFKARGAVDTRTPDWLVFVGTKEMPECDRNLIIVSIGTLRVLPREAIEAGKREEVFYSNLSAQKRAAMPKEGKWVREMVSEEMLRQYGMPIDQEILIVNRSLLKRELTRFVESLYSRLAQRKY